MRTVIDGALLESNAVVSDAKAGIVPQVTEAHKKAMVKGRQQAAAVRKYLQALESRSSVRRPDERKLRGRIDDTEQRIHAEKNPAKRVELIQRRLDYEAQLADLVEAPDMESLEKDFKDAVKEYSERKSLTYAAWRELGVRARVLREAGVPRTRRASA